MNFTLEQVKNKESFFRPVSVILMTIFCIFLLIRPSTAAIRQTLNYQGKIVASDSIPPANGTYRMRFSLYDSLTGGNLLWQETWDNTNQGSSASYVTVTDGNFSVELNSLCGSFSSGGCISNGGVDFTTDSIFLSVEFDPGNDGTYEETFSPRKRLTATPYAFHALTAEHVSSTSNAFIQDGNSFGGTATLGTNDANSLVLETNNTTALTIDTNQNVGIGTTAPSTALEVSGDGQENISRGVVRIDNTALSQWSHLNFPDDVDAADSNSNNYYMIGRGARISDRTMSFHVPEDGDYGDTTQPQFLFSSTGSETLMTIQAETGNTYIKGNVGIGTASLNSSAQFQIDSTSSGFLPPRMTTTQRDAITTPASGLQIYNTTTNTAQFYDGSGWTDIGFVNNGNSFGGTATLGTNDANSLVLETNNTTALTIDTNQNVGIGTVSPSELLDVTSATGGSSVNLNPNINDARITFEASDSIKWGIWNDNDFGGVSDVLRFDGNGGWGDTKMVINQDGNVGIGNTDPTGKLFVGSDWTESSGGENLYIGGDTGVTLTNDLGITYSVSDGTTANPDRVGLTLYNDDTTAGGWSPLLLFSKRESGTTDYKATMAGIAAKAPLGTGDGNSWIDGELHFFTAGAATDGIVNRMVIDKEGSVGIGTTDPKTKLDVDGAIKIGSQTICDANAEGAARYNTTDNVMEFCDGTDWKQIGGAPLGTIAAFNSGCPVGWSELTEARGRSIIGAGQGSGLTNRTLGETGGEETHTLTVDEMPAHNHALNADAEDGTKVSPANNFFAEISFAGAKGYIPVRNNGVEMNDASIGSAGGDQAHNNMQPYIALTWCQKMTTSGGDSVPTVTNLSDLADVSIVGPGNGSLFAYRDSIGKWEANSSVFIDDSGDFGIGTSTPSTALEVSGDGQANIYRGVVRIDNTALSQWSHLNFPDDVDAADSNSNNYYMIGRGAAISDRTMSFHVPEDGDYGDTTQPQFLFSSTGAETLMTIQAETGNTYIKGNVGIGTDAASSRKLRVSGNIYSAGDFQIVDPSDEGLGNRGFVLDPGTFNGSSTFSAWNNAGGQTIFAGKNTGSGYLTARVAFEPGVGIIRFATSSSPSTTDAVERMRITSSGAVGVNATSVDASAQFQIDSTSSGFLPPRMTTTQRDAITTPASGLQIYNTTTSTAQFYDGSDWQDIGGTLTGSYFAQNGNSFGATATLGTNDANSLVLETNNTAALTIDSSQDTVFAGGVEMQESSVSGTSGTGTLSISLNNVNGNGTLFLSELSVGDTITVPDLSNFGESQTFTISSVTSDSAATIEEYTSLGAGSFFFGAFTINTTSPARFEYDDGAVLVAGDTGTTSVTGYGKRMMWLPQKAAFRAGKAISSEWDTSNIGMGSTALGYATKASGPGSTAFGFGSIASGIGATAFGGDFVTALGSGPTASGTASTAFGRSSLASGPDSFAFGISTVASDTAAFAGGSNTEASGVYSVALGLSTTASGNQSTALGSSTTASGSFTSAFGSGTIAGATASTSFGISTVARDFLQNTFGQYNEDVTNNATSFSTSNKALVIGNGVNDSDRRNAFQILFDGSTYINNTGTNITQESTALLDLRSTTKGFLPPRMTTTQRNAITTPASGLQIYNTTTNTAQFYDGSGWTDIGFVNNGNSFGATATLGTNDSNDLVLETNNTAALTIDTDQEVGIGTSTPSYLLDVAADDASNYAASFFNDGNNANRYGMLVQAGLDDHTATGPSTLIQFNDGDGGAIGSISFGSGTVSYNQTSDQRLKEYITDTTLSVETLNTIPIRDFTWIGDSERKTQHGVIAQELHDVFPAAVTKPIDEEDTWMVDYSKLIPLIIKSVQDQNELIASLTNNTGGLGEFSTILGDDARISIEDGYAILEDTFVSHGVAYFADHVYFSKDQAGTAIVRTGEKKIVVEFEQPYIIAPIVHLTPTTFNTERYIVSDAQPEGFTILLNSSAYRDFHFNWLAIPVNPSYNELPTKTDVEQQPTDETDIDQSTQQTDTEQNDSQVRAPSGVEVEPNDQDTPQQDVKNDENSDSEEDVETAHDVADKSEETDTETVDEESTDESDTEQQSVDDDQSTQQTDTEQNDSQVRAPSGVEVEPNDQDTPQQDVKNDENSDSEEDVETAHDVADKSEETDTETVDEESTDESDTEQQTDTEQNDSQVRAPSGVEVEPNDQDTPQQDVDENTDETNTG